MLRVFGYLSAHLLRLVQSIFPHHAFISVANISPANTNHDEECPYPNWYITSWGLISRNGKMLSNLREPSHDVSDDPVYFAPTFQEVIEYLPLCSGFEGVFVRNMGRLYPARDIYYAIDGDRVIYRNRFAAERVWLRQPDKFANILATMSPSTALDHAAICAKNANHIYSDILASS
ncbi:hypothetical protein K438DRAFT_1789659 [Mycena galopus ATCC 62051]|nr:hypothetical protein K438DRAFT_1789659 [Mycena galopus ATCC 62051]